MQIIADLHIHSHYSRATSPRMNIRELGKYAAMKGLDLLGTGDFTHPEYFSELKRSLHEAGDGIYATDYNNVRFVFTAEISLIYSQGGRLRRVHNLIVAPGMDVAAQINGFLSGKGNLSADGRPVFGKLTCIEFVEECMRISKDILVIPAHAFTPWFSLFGSMSGFDSIAECFGDQLKNVHAIETGMSADPAMCWRMSQLDRVALVSNSDSHSPWPWRLGREANVFDLKKFGYGEMFRAIREKNPEEFLYTIEVDPAYGKYHFDGHRDCNISFSPAESKLRGNICPVCRRGLTIGVLHRVEELADRPVGFVPEGAIPFKSLIPLAEIVAALCGSPLNSKRVLQENERIISAFGSELNVLLNATGEELAKAVDVRVADAIVAAREGRVEITPGYDGEYGRLSLKPAGDTAVKKPKRAGMAQRGLADFADWRHKPTL